MAVAVFGAVLGVAKKMGRSQRIDHCRVHVAPWLVSRYLIARQLLSNEAVIRLVLVEGANDVIAISIRQGTIAIGAEIAIGVGIPRGIEPVFYPALAIMRRCMIA